MVEVQRRVEEEYPEGIHDGDLALVLVRHNGTQQLER